MMSGELSRVQFSRNLLLENSWNPSSVRMCVTVPTSLANCSAAIIRHWGLEEKTLCGRCG
eukprot:m.355213 g.355213  ORF g.355213 m.355213 type:complete len:60 (+) comp77700_c0_seq1:13-192(+)